MALIVQGGRRQSLIAQGGRGVTSSPGKKGPGGKPGKGGSGGAGGDFPVVAATNTSFRNTDGTTATISLAAGSAAGNLLVIFMRSTNGTIDHEYPEGWIRFLSDTSDLSDDRTSAAWRKADGGEAATIDVPISSGKFTALAWRITGAADPTIQPPEVGGLAVGADGTMDPGSLNPTGGSKKYLWLWVGGHALEATPPTGNPTNYELAVIGVTSGTNGSALTNCCVAGAARQLQAASENPPGWAISSGTPDWTAATIAVHPT